MGRTDWGPVIIGVVALGAGAYAFFNWQKICHHLGEGACNMFQNVGAATGSPGLFGGTITGTGMAQGRGQIHTDATTGTKTVINPSVPVTGAKATVRSGTSIPKKPRLQASGSVGAGAGAGSRAANYTDFNSFNTITLNRISVR